MKNKIEEYLLRLQKIFEEYVSFESESKHKDLSDLSKYSRQSLQTRAINAVRSIAGESSSYYKDIKRIIENSKHLHVNLELIIGVVLGLQDDICSGYITTLEEDVHTNTFSDYLEMAQHLSNKGFKDPAAVIAGSTLENHLRNLSEKNNLNTHDENGKNINAESLNTNLVKIELYTKTQQKIITGNLGMRNDAAHGNYNNYSKNQVNDMISSVSSFINNYPA